MNYSSQMKLGVTGLLAFAAAAAIDGRAQASFSYGVLVGPNLTYGSATGPVTETDTPGPGPYYGAPLTPPGSDTLSFNPANFAVQLLAPSTGTDSKDGELSVPVIQTNSNNVGITSLTVLDENGRYSVGGPANSSLAKVSVTLPPIFITAVNGTLLGAPVPVVASLSFNYLPDTGVPLVSITTSSNALGATGSIRFISSGDEQPLDVDEGLWSATATFNVSAALLNAGLSGNVTQLSDFALDNTTTATTITGGSAFIDKKQVLLTPTLTPEPASIALMILSGLGFAMPRRRRAQ